MLIVNKLLSQGQGLSAVLLKRAASVALDWDTRQRSRFDTDDSHGRTLGVFLPRGSVLRGGDVLIAQDGSMVRVIAEPQPVLRVAACAEHGRPVDLLRAAYHLGNRHVQLELTPDHLQLEPDHVLADMLRRMHLIVTEAQAPFEPESGAYGGTQGQGPGHDHGGHATHAKHAQHGHGDGHGDGHDRDRDRDHDHDHDHDHDRDPASPAHVHGPNCRHEP